MIPECVVGGLAAIGCTFVILVLIQIGCEWWSADQ